MGTVQCLEGCLLEFVTRSGQLRGKIIVLISNDPFPGLSHGKAEGGSGGKGISGTITGLVEPAHSDHHDRPGSTMHAWLIIGGGSSKFWFCFLQLLT